MTLVEFFTELELHHPTLTIDSLGRIRQNGPAPGKMACPLQIVFGHAGYIDIARDMGLTCTEVNGIMFAADYPDHDNLLAKEIRKRLLEMMGERE